VRCWSHPDVDAVGLCKACGKGVCKQCAVDLGLGLACANSCEVAARDLIVQIAVSRQTLVATPSAYKTQEVVGFLGAAVFAGIGGLAAFTQLWLLTPVAAILSLPLLYQGIRSRRTYRALVEAQKQLPP
jgi:hypothetical protein